MFKLNIFENSYECVDRTSAEVVIHCRGKLSTKTKNHLLKVIDVLINHLKEEENASK